MKLYVYLKSGNTCQVFNFKKVSTVRTEYENDISDLTIEGNTTYRFIGDNQLVVNGSEISYITLVKE
ncbi:hypothetical protein [Lactococcus lactis]|uniref:hypothetical protein n=1 Tax=Lactococcus lactis TaxID=1358 RepID=UPI000C9EF86B|nr:hypothetical protein [Lactococcus lactis]AUS70056.1 hypothetical protein LLG50_08235 [Lactococcus lactis subsp. lactis]WKF73052.1 hypothetical protein QYM42_11845 [Lactococcus lactis]